MMSWVGYLLTDSELFILFAENSQILFQISVIPILLTFIYWVALYLLVNNQLNSSLWHIIVTIMYSITACPISKYPLFPVLIEKYSWLARFYLLWELEAFVHVLMHLEEINSYYQIKTNNWIPFILTSTLLQMLACWQLASFHQF